MIREVDAADLEEMPDVPIPYLPLLGYDGYIVKGWSHLLSAYTRMGKTELITESIYQWLLDGERILYFTEEPEPLWIQRMKRRKLERGIDWPRGLQLVFGLGVDSKELLWRCKTGDEPIVFVDTIRTLLLPEDENDNSELARMIVPWIGTCREGEKTSIFVHHDRKTPGEHGKGISGGHAMMAACDIAIQITGIEGDQTQTKRRVHAFARVFQPPDLIYDWSDGRIVNAGPIEDVGVSSNAVQSRILSVVGDEWLLTADVMQKLGDPKPSQEQLRRMLLKLAEEGKIIREPSLGQDVKGKTVKWMWVAPTISLG